MKKGMIGVDWVTMLCHAMHALFLGFAKIKKGFGESLIMNHKNGSQWFLSCNVCDNVYALPFNSIINVCIFSSFHDAELSFLVLKKDK